MSQRDQMQHNNIDSLLQPPPKQFGDAKRIRKHPYNPFKGKSKGNNQSSRWSTFKKLIMFVPNCCK